MLKKDTFVDLTAHFIATSVVAFLFFNYSRDFKVVFACFLGGILVDLDHLIDYFLYFGLHFNLKYFFQSRFLLSRKVYLFLHHWELAAVLAVIAFLGKSMYLSAFTVSLSLHLLIDNVQRDNKFFYLFSYRLYHKFNAEKLCPRLLERLNSFI